MSPGDRSEGNGTKSRESVETKKNEGSGSAGYVIEKASEPEIPVDSSGADGRSDDVEADEASKQSSGPTPEPQPDRSGGKAPTPESPPFIPDPEAEEAGPLDTEEITDARREFKVASEKAFRALSRAAESIGKLEGLLPAAGIQVKEDSARLETELQAKSKSEKDALDRGLETKRSAYRKRFSEFSAEAHGAAWGADWGEAEVWSASNPPDLGAPPAVVRVGTTPGGDLLGAPDRVVAPLRLLDGRHVLIRAKDEDRAEAVALVQGLLLRTIASMPLGRVRYRVYDPKGLGASVESFSDFVNLDGRVTHGKPMSDPNELTEALNELAAQANKVSSQYLKGRYDSLADFLVENPGADTFEVLVLFDFPVAAGPQASQKLSSLAFGGATRGISLIVHQTLNEEAPKDFNLGDQVVTIEKEGSGWLIKGLWDDSALGNFPLEPDPPPPPQLVEQVAQREVLGPAEIGFELVLGDETWAESSAEGLETPIGRFGLATQEITLGDDPVHALIGGGSGMGKSNLLRCIVYGLANRYSPRDVSFFLLDFKQGVEFAEFARTDYDQEWLPQAKVVSVNSDRVFGAAVFEFLAEETERRNREIKRLNARKFSELREKHPDTDLPRIVLIADEFHVLFSEPDQYTERAVTALKTLAKQGRAAGIQVVLASQTISDLSRGGVGGWDAIFQQFALRIALKTTAGESRAILGERNTAAAELKGRGFAVVNKKLGQAEENQETVVARVDDLAADKVRSRLLASAREEGFEPQPPRIFDGSEAADNTLVLGHLAEDERRAPTGSVSISLGSQPTLNTADPILDVPVNAAFRQDQNRHLAILGSGTGEACSAITWSALGLAAALEPGSARFSFIDFLREDDEPAAPSQMSERLAETVGGLGQESEVIDTGRIAEFLTDLPGSLEVLSADGRKHFVFLTAFDRVPAPLINSPVGESRETPLEQLRAFVEDGAVMGGHLIGWWTTYDAFAEQFKTSKARSRFGMTGFLRVPPQSLREAGVPHSFSWDAPPNRMLWKDNPDCLDPRVFLPYQFPSDDEVEELLAVRRGK